MSNRAQWTGTPSGYTFDNDYDMFLDGDGNQWMPTSTSDLSANDYVTVPFLSGAGDAEIALSAAGLVDDGTVFGRILPGDQATVAAAQWLELDGLTYNKTALTPMPRALARGTRRGWTNDDQNNNDNVRQLRQRA